MSTAGRSMREALRMRVNMSATGSVIMVASPSPARLDDTGDQSAAGHVAEADPADPKLAIHRPRPAAQLAAQANANPFPRREIHCRRCLLPRFQLLHLLAEPG